MAKMTFNFLSKEPQLQKLLQIVFGGSAHGCILSWDIRGGTQNSPMFLEVLHMAASYHGILEEEHKILPWLLASAFDGGVYA
ncbi:hypothetical protein KSP40_PGU018748 [Platanthera guangdongensis]|uniref:Uncharacterized protein n=1 Tax=Platanthera guangdongensis TaxID=2320717 RepID=A0ABR2MJ65_9ASPA